MRILITGVSGQVGGALVARLRDREVIAADRSTIDLSRPETIPDALERLRPTTILNAAAYTAVDRAEDQKDLAMVINAIAPGVIARWAAGRGIPMVHFSTDYVFDGHGEKPWREEDATGPLSVYGETKRDGENVVKVADGSSLIVRTSWVYAAKGKNFLRTIARLAREREELRIVADQFGAPTSADLIASALTNMLSEDFDLFRRRCSQCNGLVHLAAAGETSWYGFACAIIEGLRARGIDFALKKSFPSAPRTIRHQRVVRTILGLIFQNCARCSLSRLRIGDLRSNLNWISWR